MTKLKKILLVIFAILAALIIISVTWFNTYHYFSPLYKPCTKQLFNGMSYNEARKVMSPFFNNPIIQSDDSMYQSGNKRVMQFSDEKGVFCYIEFNNKKTTEINFGRE